MKVIKTGTKCYLKSKIKPRQDTDGLVDTQKKSFIANKVGEETMFGGMLSFQDTLSVEVVSQGKIDGINTVVFRIEGDSQEFSTFYLVFKQMFDIPKDAIITSTSDLSSKIAKMAGRGIYVEVYQDDNGANYFDNSECGGSVIFIDGKGKARYMRGSQDTEWNCLQWNCAPTRKKVAKGYTEVYDRSYQFLFERFSVPDSCVELIYTWEYYPSWNDFVLNCKLPVMPQSKIINPE